MQYSYIFSDNSESLPKFQTKKALDKFVGHQLTFSSERPVIPTKVNQISDNSVCFVIQFSGDKNPHFVVCKKMTSAIVGEVNCVLDDSGRDLDPDDEAALRSFLDAVQEARPRIDVASIRTPRQATLEEAVRDCKEGALQRILMQKFNISAPPTARDKNRHERKPASDVCDVVPPYWRCDRRGNQGPGSSGNRFDDGSSINRSNDGRSTSRWDDGRSTSRWDDGRSSNRSDDGGSSSRSDDWRSSGRSDDSGFGRSDDSRYGNRRDNSRFGKRPQDRRAGNRPQCDPKDGHLDQPPFGEDPKILTQYFINSGRH